MSGQKFLGTGQPPRTAELGENYTGAITTVSRT